MDIYEVFKKLNIEYNEIEHKPLYTILDAKVIKGKIEGQECKNLFLTDNKDGYYLVIIEDKKRADLKQLQELLIDNDLKNKMLLFHPNANTKTVSIKYDDLIKFIEFEKHKYMFI